MRYPTPSRIGQLTLLALLLLAPGRVAAQDFGDPETIPDELAADVLAWFNDPDLIRFEGRAVLPEGSEIVGPVGLLRGELVVRGTIRGDVVLLDADLRIEETGRIEGDVLVIGGDIRAEDAERVSGLVTEYVETFRWRDEGGELVLDANGLRDDRGIRLLGSRFLVKAGTNYNRVEGLPVLFGPVIESSGRNPLRFEGLVTYRTESGFTDDDLGFRVSLERRIGRPSRLSYGASAYSEVTPIERWGLGDLEASLTTFLLHRDYRDYFERHGWSVHVGASLPDFPLRMRVAYRDEKHFTLPLGSPWSLNRNDRAWRPLPLVGEGDVRLIDFDFQADGRNNPEDPSDGWYLSGRLRHGLTGDARIPSYSLDSMDVSAASATEALPTEFSSGFLDLRRYARVDPTSHLSLRMVLGGSLNGHRLPPQFQHALGGEGSLPGWSPLQLDCGARSTEVWVVQDETTAERRFPSYGCDRIALFQAEYRKTLLNPITIGSGESDWIPRIDLEPTLVGFFDVGGGWSETAGGTDFTNRGDVGIGLEIGSLAGYFAYPLGGDRKFNFFVRLQRRF